MRVLVDFLPLLPRGGGLQNALNLWRAVETMGGDHEWLAVARPELGLEPGVRDGREVRLPVVRSLAHRLWLENRVLPALAESWSADVVWTPMGAGPLRAPVPRVMGWHDSTVVYPDVATRGLSGAGRIEQRFRGLMARRAARGATRITVQTPTMRRRLAATWGVPEDRFVVVPNGRSGLLADEAPRTDPAAGHPPERTILVVAEAKPAKNLEIVPWVARALRERGDSDTRFVLTIPPRGGPWTGPFEEALEAAGDGLPIERIGRVPHGAIGDLYRKASVVFLPSLCESFSATYVEAMHFGVPLVTSDRDFARDLCGDAAVYVDPENAEACAAALERVLTDSDLRARLRAAGFERVRTFPDWPERYALYLGALEAAASEEPHGRRAGSGSRGRTAAAAPLPGTRP